MTKYLILISFITISCSHLNQPSRHIAGTRLSSENLQIQLSSKLIFANGANSVFVRIQAPEGQSIQARDLRILSDIEIEQAPFQTTNGVLQAQIRPKVKSPNIRLMVAYKEETLSNIVELQTTLSPFKTMLEKEPWSPSGATYVSGIYYVTDRNIAEGLYVGMKFSNNGDNKIVDATAYPHSQRDFEFEFEQQATQNNSMMINDSPNSTTSHGMYSQMMLFPRTYLPHAEIKKNKIVITLATGEKMGLDAKTGEIIDGVFTEGPVDIGPDRFKRTYADIKYFGKGILLRANARGQMPQQGQFEATKIDMEYGIKGSSDVLIINGTTGQRCRRPKADFWSNADVTPILFKFPSDQELDVYLKAKCQFGIPQLAQEQRVESEDSKVLALDIWKKCEDQSRVDNYPNYLLNMNTDYISAGVKSCLNGEIEALSQKDLKSQVAFDLYFIYRREREEEKKLIQQKITESTVKIKEELLNDVSWSRDSDCLSVAKKVPDLVMKYHSLQKKLDLPTICREVEDEIEASLKAELGKLSKKLIYDLSWLGELTNRDKFLKDCQSQILLVIDRSFRFSNVPTLYKSLSPLACLAVEKSSGYQGWLEKNVGVLEEKVFIDTLELLENLANKKAESCIVTYPMNSALNRIRFKVQRQSCLMDVWEQLEGDAIRRSLKSPVVTENIKSRLGTQRRALQLKVIKKYFVE